MKMIFATANIGWMRVRKRRGMTLVEMMITMGIFSFVVMAFMYAHLFGLTQDQLVQSKLGASDSSRRGFQTMSEDVRRSKTWQIGNVSSDVFTPITNGEEQIGNAVQIGTSIGSTSYIRYFFDTSAGELRRASSGVNGYTVIADYLTNSMSFRAENYRGEIQTELNHKGVISVALEFRQYQYPLTQVGNGNFYDYYKMAFKLTPHVPDGQ